MKFKRFFITCPIYHLSVWLLRSCVMECRLMAVMVMIEKPSTGQQSATRKASLTSCWKMGRTWMCKIVVGRRLTWLHTTIVTSWKYCCTIVQIDPSWIIKVQQHMIQHLFKQTISLKNFKDCLHIFYLSHSWIVKPINELLNPFMHNVEKWSKIV